MISFIEINVSINGSHYFATAPRSIGAYDFKKAESIAQEFNLFYSAKYPGDKVEVSVTQWLGTGTALVVGGVKK